MELCFKDKIQGASRYFGKMSKYRQGCYFGRVIPSFFILDSRGVGFSPNLGVKSMFDFYKILPKVKRRFDPQNLFSGV